MTVVDAPDWGFKQGDFIVYQASGQWKIKFVTRFESRNGDIETWGLTYDMKHGDGDKGFEMEWLIESFTDSLNSDKWRFATVFEVEAFGMRLKVVRIIYTLVFTIIYMDAEKNGKRFILIKGYLFPTT